jgi:hypothetical protein
MVLAALLRSGKTPLLPFGGCARYDLAYDEDAHLVRVQCKTAVLRNGCLSFNSRSLARDGSMIHYDGDADMFGIYSPDTGAVYLVPVELVARSKGSLRLEPPKNGQKNGILWAEDYKVL